jgi:alkylhydroperoxidase family enzyme
MAHVRTIPPDGADGRLESVYRAAVERAGKVFQILQVQSLNASVLAASMGLYQAIMHGDSPLSRVEREAIAVTVSRANDCFY